MEASHDLRTNGFAVFLGDEAGSRAAGSTANVQRSCREIVLRPLELAQGYAVAFSLEESGDAATLPLVHGMGEAEGEFACVKTGEDGAITALRDPLGTRGLYVDPDWTCVATDHRFFGTRPRLLPGGAQASLESGEVSTVGVSSEPSGLSLEEAAERLADLLRGSVRRRVAGRRKVAVSFSGGLDSSLVALLASRETEVVLCSAFAAGSRDQGQTLSAAEALGLELVTKEMTREEVSAEVRSVGLPSRPGEMDLALWALYSTTSRTASQEGAELVLLGQLADELFGGYMKYALAARRAPAEADAMMRSDVAACGNGAFVRDEMACARFSEARFPFADASIASFAFGLPLHYKIAGGERKVVLRRAAELVGLPEPLANAPKKAAQYSSGISKLVR